MLIAGFQNELKGAGARVAREGFTETLGTQLGSGEDLGGFLDEGVDEGVE